MKRMKGNPKMMRRVLSRGKNTRMRMMMLARRQRIMSTGTVSPIFLMVSGLGVHDGDDFVSDDDDEADEEDDDDEVHAEFQGFGDEYVTQCPYY